MSSRFCPICAGYHNPSVGCASRAESALREAGINPPPARGKSLQTQIKEADRLMIYRVLFILGAILVGIVPGLLGSGPQ